jgi:pimeloyl-ACP methyl ester carboxylesterase
MWRVAWYVLIQVGTALLAATLELYAQPVPEDVRGRMADVLRYTGLNTLAPGDVTRMAELWTRAQQPGLAREERRLAFRDMYLLYAKLQGRDLGDRPQTLDGFTQFVMATFEGGGRMQLTLPEPRGTPDGTYVHVETRGSGPTPLLLISDLGVDGRSLYDSFVRRQGSAYTMHIVTLPYAGLARPLPWPERLDYASRPWLDEIERELLTLLDQPRMKGITVVGTSGGGYFAARLALLRPQQVQRAVLVHALVSSPMRAEADPDAPAPLEQRLLRVKSLAPSPQLFPVAPVPPPEELRRLIGDPSSTHPTARNWMAFAVKDATLSRAWTFEALAGGFFLPSLEYGFELLATDLGEQLKTLAVPTLAMGSWHDEGSPVQSPPSVSQWEEVKLRYPEIPLSVVAFDETRAYISADAPEEFDRALADFLAGRAVHGKASCSLPGSSSPRGSVMQSVAGAEIHIAYGRPAVKGRTVWGELVPNGRVWRAGIDEATSFSFGRDVKIEGHALPAGTYTFFVLPGAAEWTLIFNRVPRQWGASSYNPAFDALRVSAKPVEAAHEEYLRYEITAEGSNTARVVLAWEKRRVAFRIEAPAVGER